jgi:large subunit ribosomal protein L6
MSRVGKYPVPIPAGVTAEIHGAVLTIKGPKGELTRTLHPDMMIEVGEGSVTVRRPSDSKLHKSLHGLTRTLIANMVTGVSKGYEKNLEIEGVEYRAELKGATLMLSLGFASPVRYEPRTGITITVSDPKKISITGIDKEKVGQTAAEIRSLRPPEPYKGKGVRYAGEQIKRKAGKAAVGTGF